MDDFPCIHFKRSLSRTRESWLQNPRGKTLRMTDAHLTFSPLDIIDLCDDSCFGSEAFSFPKHSHLYLPVKLVAEVSRAAKAVEVAVSSLDGPYLPFQTSFASP